MWQVISTVAGLADPGCGAERFFRRGTVFVEAVLNTCFEGCGLAANDENRGHRTRLQCCGGVAACVVVSSMIPEGCGVRAMGGGRGWLLWITMVGAVILCWSGLIRG